MQRQDSQRRDREETPNPFQVFGFGNGEKSREERAKKLEQIWIPYLEQTLDEARQLLSKLRPGG